MSQGNAKLGRRDTIAAFLVFTALSPSLAANGVNDSERNVIAKSPRRAESPATTAFSEGVSGLFSGSAVSVAKQVADHML